LFGIYYSTINYLIIILLLLYGLYGLHQLIFYSIITQKKLKKLPIKQSTPKFVKNIFICVLNDQKSFNYFTKYVFFLCVLQSELDSPIEVSEILRRVAPEQALTAGELVELLKADELAKALALNGGNME
jgi:hypothetical protein